MTTFVQLLSKSRRKQSIVEEESKEMKTYAKFKAMRIFKEEQYTLWIYNGTSKWAHFDITSTYLFEFWSRVYSFMHKFEGREKIFFFANMFGKKKQKKDERTHSHKIEINFERDWLVLVLSFKRFFLCFFLLQFFSLILFISGRPLNIFLDIWCGWRR